jgi:Meiotically up-regulated gene 113
MPYQVAFEIFSENHEQLEAAMHAELAAFRLVDRREFFHYPLSEAITKLQSLNR